MIHWEEIWKIKYDLNRSQIQIRLSRSLERNMKHGYSKRRINQPIKIQIVTFERLVFSKRKYFKQNYEK